jgi:hypothetical protein
MTVLSLDLKRPTRLFPKQVSGWMEYQELVPAGTPMSMLISGEFFAKVGQQLRPNDLIDCVEASGAYEIKLRLRSKIGDKLHFAVLSKREAEAA